MEPPTHPGARRRGKEKRLSLGVYPDVSPRDARDRRDEARKLLVNGIDPNYRWRREYGTALIERDGLDYPTWDDRRGNAPREVREREQSLEKAVSGVIGEMPLLWLSIEDPPGRGSWRGYLERNSIALLSNYGRHAMDPSSGSWLGQHCSREKVQASGLWNSNHVDEGYAPAEAVPTVVEGS